MNKRLAKKKIKIIIDEYDFLGKIVPVGEFWKVEKSWDRAKDLVTKEEFITVYHHFITTGKMKRGYSKLKPCFIKANNVF